ncbi:uncharacterized protein LOC128999033 [Macrosteles quadrilineatus]|uniref:uncharacterized protein LOC128999033 n=1 Tax=Macrosteles quadrilineatus TaxID=74068 RepID=UPI0023E1196C|nr:uncharacterized protein LOC128999033 [Macrosteles quadrilineatus]
MRSPGVEYTVLVFLFSHGFHHITSAEDVQAYVCAPSPHPAPSTLAPRNGEFSRILLLFSISVGSRAETVVLVSRYTVPLYKIPPFLGPLPLPCARPRLPTSLVACSERTADRLYQVLTLADNNARTVPITFVLLIDVSTNPDVLVCYGGGSSGYDRSAVTALSVVQDGRRCQMTSWFSSRTFRCLSGVSSCVCVRGCAGVRQCVIVRE